MNAQAHNLDIPNSFHASKPVRAMLAQVGISDLLNTEGVTEVAVNRPGEIWYEKGGKWYHVSAPLLTYDTCTKLAHAMAVGVAGKADQLNKNPICPVLLPDGERGQIVMPPATEKGCVSFTIRKPSLQRFSLEDYQQSGRFSDYKISGQKKSDLEEHEKEMVMAVKDGDLLKFFRLAVLHKKNIIFGGITGSGKTTALKAVADLYPYDRRIITIEDVHELSLPYHRNRVHLFYGDHLPAKECVRSCMRMKGDHIFMSELRGDETWDYLGLLNTGHDGGITSAHFNDCASATPRLAQMVKQSEVGMTLDYDFIYKTIQTTMDIVCHWSGSYLREVRYMPEEKLELLNA